MKRDVLFIEDERLEINSVASTISSSDLEIQFTWKVKAEARLLEEARLLKETCSS